MIRDMIDKQIIELKKLWANKRQLLFQVLNLAMIVFSALMIWKGLMFLTKVCSISEAWTLYGTSTLLVCMMQQLTNNDILLPLNVNMRIVRVPRGGGLVGFHGTGLSTR